MVGKVCKSYDGILYRESFMVSLFKKVLEHVFDQKIKDEEERNDLMVDFTKISMTSRYGQSIRKDIDKKLIIRSECWLVKNNDERVVHYEALPNGE